MPPTSPTSRPTDAAGASAFLPFGFLGIWAAIPFAIWFFLAVEGVPLAAEEAANPERNVPRGIIAAMAVLLVTGAARAVPGHRRAGRSRRCRSPATRWSRRWATAPLAKVVNYIGLAGLIASFFSIIYAYSRQTVRALARRLPAARALA